MPTNSATGGLPIRVAQLPNYQGNLTATGTTLGGAYQIPSGQDMSVFTTVSAGAGVKLPLAGVSPGESYVVANHGANALLVYPPRAADQVGTVGSGVGVSIGVGKACEFYNIGYGLWCCNNGA